MGYPESNVQERMEVFTIHHLSVIWWRSRLGRLARVVIVQSSTSTETERIAWLAVHGWLCFGDIRGDHVLLKFWWRRLARLPALCPTAVDALPMHDAWHARTQQLR